VKEVEGLMKQSKWIYSERWFLEKQKFLKYLAPPPCPPRRQEEKEEATTYGV
jgi:hypothetical protein